MLDSAGSDHDVDVLGVCLHGANVPTLHACVAATARMILLFNEITSTFNTLKHIFLLQLNIVLLCLDLLHQGKFVSGGHGVPASFELHLQPIDLLHTFEVQMVGQVSLSLLNPLNSTVMLIAQLSQRVGLPGQQVRLRVLV